ncbi:MAG: gamma-glutamylcyclotransferase family protein [Sphingobium sp.]|jgi:gamma-glutamylcyclotransferase (GGCT)/AIG2-like uncharacterized protein YtfP|nr:gamma-glutamylcyclotransferase [Sphingobium sp.]MCP5399501.1 gamma-glutamylcyclotransferase [Sphingomonas sp.]
MTGDCDLLFVYGTLRQGCDNAQARALTEMAEWLCTAQVSGRLLKVDWYPALTQGQGTVTGDIFRLHDPQAALALLDAYEECTSDFPQPWEYRREIVSADTPEGMLRAWTYLYNRPADELPGIPGGDWLNV